MHEHVRRGDVASVVRPQEQVITFYRAEVEIYTPSPKGGSWIEYEHCKHQHKTSQAALSCGRGLARRERAKRAANGNKPVQW